MVFGIISGVFGFLKWAFTTASLAGLAARTAIMIGANYLINRALAPSIKDPERPDGYTFSPQTTEQQGIAVPVHYGNNRIHANIVGHYLSIGDGLVSAGKVSRYILACFGEGPIEAPDETTVRLNGRPLSDFTSVTAQWRLGTIDQTVLDDWATFRQDYHVGQECQPNEPITFTLPRTGYDDIAIHFQLPKGIIHYGTDGDKHSLSVTLRIEVGDAIADTWQTLAEHAVGGRTAQPCYLRYRASGAYSGGSAFAVTPSMQPRVRVTRLSGVSSNPRYISDLQFAAVQVTRNIGFTHPGMVLLSLAMVPTEATAGGVTELSVESSGRILDDGAGAFGVSRYHADAMRDILTQPVIEGDGSPQTPWTAGYYRAVDPSRLVAAGFTAQKALADTLVPDSNGKNMPMLRNDCIFATGTSVHAAIGAVAASGRCGLAYMGRSFGLWIESPREPLGLLCDGTWQRHSAELMPIEHDQLASEATVRYRDADAAFAERTILVTDHQMDTLTTVNLELAGVTRTHEAARLARRELARNRLVDRTLTCRADIDTAVYEAGDVVYAQIDGRSLGGRITAVTATTVTLDRSVTGLLTGNDVLLVQVRNAETSVQALDIQAVASVSSNGKIVTIDGIFDCAPSAGDPFLFGPAELLDDDQFEVTETALDEHLHATLSLVRYTPILDDLDAVPPGVTVPLGAIQRIHQYGGVLRPALPGATIDAIGARGAVVFEWGNYTFAAGDPGKIIWATDTDDEGEPSGYVRHGSELHQPADNPAGTAAAYVYWDPASPTVFLTTNDPADWVNKYLVAINAAGAPITGVHWAPLDPEAADWAKVNGSSKPEDNATDDSTWRHSGDPSKIDGALIYNGTIIASALNVATLDAITANLGSVTSGTITLNLGGNARLRIDSNGIYVSDDAGATWDEVLYNDSGTVTLSADILKAGELVADRISATTLAGTYVKQNELVGTFLDITVANVVFEYDPDPEDQTWRDIGAAFAGDPGITLRGYVKVYDGNTYSWPLDATVRLRLVKDGTTIVETWSRDVSLDSAADESKLPIAVTTAFEDDSPYQFQYMVFGAAADDCDLNLHLKYKYTDRYTPVMAGTFFDVTVANVDFEYDPDPEDQTWRDIGAAFTGDPNIVYAGAVKVSDAAPFGGHWPLEATVRLRLVRDGLFVSETWSRDVSLISATDESSLPARIAATLSPLSTYQFQYMVFGGSADTCDLNLFIEFGYGDKIEVTK